MGYRVFGVVMATSDNDSFPRSSQRRKKCDANWCSPSGRKVCWTELERVVNRKTIFQFGCCCFYSSMTFHVSLLSCGCRQDPNFSVLVAPARSGSRKVSRALYSTRLLFPEQTHVVPTCVSCMFALLWPKYNIHYLPIALFVLVKVFELISLSGSRRDLSSSHREILPFSLSFTFHALRWTPFFLHLCQICVHAPLRSSDPQCVCVELKLSQSSMRQGHFKLTCCFA